MFGDGTIAEHRPIRSTTALHRLLATMARANQRLHAQAQASTSDTSNRVLQAAARVAKTNYAGWRKTTICFCSTSRIRWQTPCPTGSG